MGSRQVPALSQDLPLAWKPDGLSAEDVWHACSPSPSAHHLDAPSLTSAHTHTHTCARACACWPTVHDWLCFQAVDFFAAPYPLQEVPVAGTDGGHSMGEGKIERKRCVCVYLGACHSTHTHTLSLSLTHTHTPHTHTRTHLTHSHTHAHTSLTHTPPPLHSLSVPQASGGS